MGIHKISECRAFLYEDMTDEDIKKHKLWMENRGYQAKGYYHSEKGLIIEYKMKTKEGEASCCGLL